MIFGNYKNYLRKETTKLYPNFYCGKLCNELCRGFHQIEQLFYLKFMFDKTDTIVLKQQVELKVLIELICVNSETINYLNPSFKKQIYPAGAMLRLPSEIVNDFLLNEKSNYTFIEMVDNKEILIDEERIVYRVQKGDYLGRIAKEHQVHVFEIKEWNNLKTTNLDIGDKLSFVC